MIAYTDAELLAVARVVWPNCTSSTVLYGRSRDALAYGMLRASEPKYTGAVEFCVRLALEHPERAGEALGLGWEVMTGSAANGRAVFVWCAQLDIGELELWVRDGGVALVVSDDQVFEIPPEFDTALSRARLIAAARQRIEAAKAKELAGE